MGGPTAAQSVVRQAILAGLIERKTRKDIDDVIIHEDQFLDSCVGHLAETLEPPRLTVHAQSRFLPSVAHERRPPMAWQVSTGLAHPGDSTLDPHSQTVLPPQKMSCDHDICMAEPPDMFTLERLDSLRSAFLRGRLSPEHKDDVLYRATSPTLHEQQFVQNQTATV